jgi:nitrate/nitrite-specific signal transduction histidine kinase
MATQQKVSWLHSIQTQVAFATIVITTLVLGGFAIYNTIVNKQKMESQLKQLAEITATRLSKHLVIPLWDLDQNSAEEAVKAEMLEQQIYAIIVRDSNGTTTFAGKTRDRNWEISDLQLSGVGAQGMASSTQNITYQGEVIGKVEVYLTPQFLEAELQQTTLDILIQVLVLDLLIFLLVFLILRKLILQPVDKLTEAAESMSRGNLGTKITIRSKNELRMVADAMDRMRESLQITMNELRQR